MQTSDTITDLAPALLDAQKAFQPVFKEHVAKVKSSKGSFDYSYADLADVMQSCMESLQNAGILMQQEATTDGAKVSVCTRFTHAASGQFQEFSGLVIDAGTSSAQAIGSAITYGRRYQLITAIGIAPDDDDGGKAQQAFDRNRQQSQQQRPSNGQTTQQKPAQQKPAEQPKADDPVAKLKHTLKSHAKCENVDDCMLLINWATNNAFLNWQDAQQAAPEILECLRAKHKEIPIGEMLQMARSVEAAQAAFTE